MLEPSSKTMPDGRQGGPGGGGNDGGGTDGRADRADAAGPEHGLGLAGGRTRADQDARAGGGPGPG